WPPLSREIAPGVRVEHPVMAYGLAFNPRPAAGRNLAFDISGKDPSFLIPVDLDATAYDTVEIELRGEVPGVTDALGAVTFATDTRGLEHSPRIEFSWRVDGTRQLVRVPLRQQAQWRGTITHVRIEPIDEEQASRGRIELGEVR